MAKMCPRCRNLYKKCSCSTPGYAACYREGVMVELVENYKYKSIRETAEVLADFLDAAIPSEIDQALLVPLPTVNKHIRQRGFDHMYKIAKELSRRRKGFLVCRALVRRGQKTQVGQDAKTRKAQAKGAYALNPRWTLWREKELSNLNTADGTYGRPSVSGERLTDEKLYILIDDVWTTGASMEAAIRVMREAGVKNLASAVILMPRIGD